MIFLGNDARQTKVTTLAYFIVKNSQSLSNIQYSNVKFVINKKKIIKKRKHNNQSKSPYKILNKFL